jgi:integrase
MSRVVDAIARDIGHAPLTAVNYGFLRDYCERLLKDGKLAPATVNRRMSAVGVALRECVRRGELPSRPDLPHYQEDNKRERYMTSAEEAGVLDWLRRRAQTSDVMEPGTGEPWEYVRRLAEFLLDTGFRFSESFLFQLSGEDADLAHGLTKTSQGRRVPLTPRALAAARYLVASRLHATLGADKRPKVAWDYISHRWQQATKACGCPDVTLHILRHTCASRLVQEGVPIFTVSKWLGHSSVKVTERYAKLAPDSLRGALGALARFGTTNATGNLG